MNTTETKYQTTKEDCQTQCDGKICPYCGNKIEPIETVDNAHSPTFWPGCNDCNRFTYGTTEDIRRIAVRMVRERFYTHYHDQRPISGTEEFERWERNQIGGACSIVTEVLVFQKEILPTTPIHQEQGENNE